jgi:hypothetical protein
MLSRPYTATGNPVSHGEAAKAWHPVWRRVRRGMRFPVNVTSQKRCPVCKKAGPGTNPPVVPRQETAALLFVVQSFVHGRSYPVFLGSDLILGWDSGVAKSPRSRASLGAAFTAARKEARDANAGRLEIQFCSIRCLRQFLMDAVDELERRVAAVEPEVRVASG